MKTILGVFIFFLFVSNRCHGQVVGQKISVTVLREDKKIDNLMEMALKDESHSGTVDPIRLKDSCWFLEMLRWKRGDTCSFQLTRNSKPVINFRVNILEHRKKSYGLFIYKGYTVFVWSFDSFDGFFTPTAFNRSFDYLFYSNDAKATEEEMYANIMHYRFAHGSFSVEGPPTIQ